MNELKNNCAGAPLASSGSLPGILTVICLALVLQACQSAPTLPPARKVKTIEVKAEPDTANVVSYPLEQQRNIIATDDPWILAEQAQQLPVDRRASMLLQAVSGFIELEQIATAASLIEQIDSRTLTDQEKLTLRINHAALFNVRGAYDRAIDLLVQWRTDPGIDRSQLPRLLDLLARAYVGSAEHNQAIITLLQRDRFVQSTERIANQQQLLGLLRTLDPLSQSLLREGRNDSVLNGWIDLSNLLQTILPAQRVVELDIWRHRYPHHPIEETFLARLRQIDIDTRQYQQIALLLPLTSGYGTAARAYYDGFMQAYQDDTSSNRPVLSLHDIGDDPELAYFYFQAAVNEGAEFIVGPLGRNAVSSLLTAPELAFPTLLIGSIGHEQAAENLYGISLSPEQEARAVAYRAFADGHRRAAILRNDSAWGKRVAAAFTGQWQTLGGVIQRESYFPEGVSDYTQQIRRALNINESIVRRRKLSAKLGVPLEFTPVRRQDLDFMFLAANADQARLVTPQLRFHQAHDLPLYATSYIFDGSVNPGLDADLNGIVFGDMPWMIDHATFLLDQQAREQAAAELEKEKAQENLEQSQELPLQTEPVEAVEVEDEEIPVEPASPYRDTPLDRLYALGLESYHLIPRLHALRGNTWEQYHGNAFSAQVDADGNVVRGMDWIQFEQGLPVQLNPLQPMRDRL